MPRKPGKINKQVKEIVQAQKMELEAIKQTQMNRILEKGNLDKQTVLQI